MIKNLLKNIPTDLSEEVFETLATGSNIKIERIISKGHITPEGDWYDQDQDEWVMVLKGHGILEFESPRDQEMMVLETKELKMKGLEVKEIEMKAGDAVNIPKHCKHRVKWTDPNQETIWLAVFYG
jgi:cupin 2 domain-containing protein